MDAVINLVVAFTPESRSLLDRLAAMASPAAAAVAAPLPTIPQSAAGERYAGIAFNEEGKPSHHLFLLDPKPAARMTWQAANDWAEAIGASLPTRFESALLYANLRDQFDTSAWYWTGTQFGAADAWYQLFYGGYQGDTGKSYEALARAVRRLPI